MALPDVAFVVEVRPEGMPAYRAGAEQKIRDFEVPAVGSALRVEYQDKHPGSGRTRAQWRRPIRHRAEQP
jgi:hypothetical protein